MDLNNRLSLNDLISKYTRYKKLGIISLATTGLSDTDVSFAAHLIPDVTAADSHTCYAQVADDKLEEAKEYHQINKETLLQAGMPLQEYRSRLLRLLEPFRKSGDSLLFVLNDTFVRKFEPMDGELALCDIGAMANAVRQRLGFCLYNGICELNKTLHNASRDAYNPMCARMGVVETECPGVFPFIKKANAMRKVLDKLLQQEVAVFGYLN